VCNQFILLLFCVHRHHYVTADINLDYQICHLDGNRERLQQAKKKYGAKIKIHDPGLLGSILLTSESEEFTALDVINEFEIEPLDHYFERSMKYREMNKEN
jgi:hypothetical protein